MSRQSFTHWLWTEPRTFSKWEAWLDLLQLAAFVPTKRIVRGKLLNLERGDLIASVRFLGTRWNWSKTKVGEFLSVLEQDGMIGRKAGQGETVISLCNYGKWNPEKKTRADTDADKPRTPGGQSADKVEEREEGEHPIERAVRVALNASMPTETKAPISLQQAISYASMVRMTAEEAEFWWRTRNSSGWMKADRNGGVGRRITSPQDDMATSIGWVREQLARIRTAGKSPRNPHDPRPV